MISFRALYPTHGTHSFFLLMNFIFLPQDAAGRNRRSPSRSQQSRTAVSGRLNGEAVGLGGEYSLYTERNCPCSVLTLLWRTASTYPQTGHSNSSRHTA
jgi:hypothetical protein